MFFLEFVLRVSPLAMACLQLLGWYEFACMHSCLLVCFMCVFISGIPVVSKSGPLYTVVSGKVSSALLYSWVNLMVGGLYGFHEFFSGLIHCLSIIL